MKTLSSHLKKRIQTEEMVRIMEHLQQSGVDNHGFLSSPQVLSALRRQWLERIGAVLLAITVSAISIIANYFIFVRMLHTNF
ncbi:MAG: hypothetical protein PHH11_09250 [Methylomonas sp.]|nr:hypothetical protein [Methylomonas sp.]